MYHEIDPPEWVPDLGCALRKTGLYFDAIRIAGAHGERVAEAVEKECGGEPGPVVREAIGRRWVYFILPPDTVRQYRWPPSSERYSALTPGRIAYIGIPALGGDTWPLFWRSQPTPERRFVDPGILNAVVTRDTGVTG